MRRDGVDPASSVADPSPGGVDDETVQIQAHRGRHARQQAERPRRRTRRAVIVVLAVAILLAVVAGGGWYLYHSIVATPDYQVKAPGPS